MAPDQFTLSRALGTIRDLGWTPGGIVDIGVAAGTPGLYSAWPGTPLCLIEPSPDSAVFLRQIAEKYPNVRIFNCAASDHSGEMKGHQPEGLVNVFFGRGRNYPEKSFQARTCDDMVEEAGLASPLLLKIDTDSHEREVLAGAEATLARTEVCVIETNVFHPLRRQIAPTEIWRFLAERGFAFFDIADCSIGGNGILRAADFVFVRPELELFREARERSPKGKQARRERQYREYVKHNPDI